MLTATNISKYFNGKVIVNDVSLTVEPHKITAIMGANGAGKSTCFHMLTGLTTPDKGDVYLNRISITHDPLYKRVQKGIGYLPQETCLFGQMTVSENILCALEINKPKLTNQDRQDILNQLLDQFELNHVSNTQTQKISGGEKRRTEIARTLAISPSYLLLDEPFAGIDPKSIQEIKQLIHHLKNHQQIGILISDHNVRETLALADTVYIIHKGQILASGTPEEVVKHSLVKQYYLGQQPTH